MERVAERKLQDIGGSLFVSLPPIWTRDSNLEKGDTVGLYVEGRKLIVLPMEGTGG